MNANAHIPGDHGYEFAIPSTYADGKPHTIYVYGIDVSGGDPNALLTNAPKSIFVVPATSTVSFDYDNAGNRKKMTDETGYTNYQYDSLSRMTKETKHLRDGWTIANHDFDIEYAYNLSGGLRSVTDPFGQSFEYKTDIAGRLKKLTGSAGGGPVRQLLVHYGRVCHPVQHGRAGAGQRDRRNRLEPLGPLGAGQLGDL